MATRTKSCLASIDIERLIDGACEPGEAEVFRAHLDGCPRCAELYARGISDRRLGRDLQRAFARPVAESLDDGREQGESASPADAALIEPGLSGQSFPGYRLIEELHRGGQGVVYRAVQLATRRDVALKVLLHGRFSSDAELRRFQREIDLAAGLRHPYVVTLYDSGLANGRLFCSMELVEGTAIDVYCRKLRKSSSTDCVREIFELFEKVCEGVSYAQQRGVIHRDLKPSNILVDSTGQPRIIDFGLAKQTRASSLETRTGEFLGTLAYASPEQTTGNVASVDVRSDVYSLGVILYELLTDRLPYSIDGSLVHVIERICLHIPDPPGRVCPGIDDDGDTIVMTALRKEPAARYPSAAQLQADIRRYLDHDPIDAKRDSRWYVLRMAFRRHRLLALSASAILLMLCAATAVSALFGMQAINERNSARESATIAKNATEAERDLRGEAEALARESEYQSYLGFLAAADAAARNHDAFNARRRLNSAPEKLRAWEFYFLSNYLRRCERVIVELDHAIARMAASATAGRLFVNGRNMGNLIRVEGGMQQTLSLERPAGAYALTADGKSLFVADQGGVILQYDADTLELVETIGQVEADPYSIALSSDGGRVAVSVNFPGRQASMVTVFDVARCESILEIENPTALCRSMAFDAEGRRLAIGLFDIEIWDLIERDRLCRLPGHTAWVESICFFSSGDRLLTGSLDNTVRVWNLPQQRVEQILRGHSSFVNSVAISADEDMVASASSDKTIRLWDWKSGEQTAVLWGHELTINSVAFVEGPEGRRLVSSSVDGSVRWWDPGATPAQRILRGHRSSVRSVTYSDGGRFVVSGSDDRTARVWDALTGELLFTLRPHGDIVRGAAICEATRTIVTGCNDAIVRIWSLETGELLRTLDGHTDMVHAIVIREDGRKLYTGSRDNLIIEWDPETGEALRTFTGHDDHIHRLTLNHDESLIASAGHNTVKIWSLETGREVKTLDRRIAMDDFSLSFHPTESRLLAGNEDGSVLCWDVATGSIVDRWPGHEGEITALSIHPRGDRAATASMGGSLKLWDVGRAQDILILQGNNEFIYSVAFSPNGDWLATGHWDGTVRLWDGRPTASIQTSDPPD